MDTHLSRWQLSIEPQGQWRDRRKPLSSSFWLLLSPLRLLSLLAFNCTFLCVQNSQSSNTLVQDSSNLFTIGVPACPCFALSSALFPLSPFIHSDLFEFWAREQNLQQMIDSGLRGREREIAFIFQLQVFCPQPEQSRGSKSLAPCPLDRNSERISSDTYSVLSSTCWMFWLCAWAITQICFPLGLCGSLFMVGLIGE